MHVAVVIPYIGDKSSGPAHSVPGMCAGLNRSGVNVELHALNPLPSEVFPFATNGYPWRSFPYRPLGCSPDMRKALCRRAREVDIIHNNSLWMMPNIYPGIAVRDTRCKLVTAPRGTMTVYSMNRSRWKKNIMMWMGQRMALEQTHLFHATSEAELADIRRLGWRQPVVVIPNGIDVPEFRKRENVDVSNGGRRVLLYLSRIHPEKRVDLLLKVWKHIAPQRLDWDLWICGPLNGEYPKKMLSLSQELRLQRVFFKGEVLAEEKSQTYRVADLFVLPTNTENFGMVVAEALAHGTPAVVSKGAPWQGLVSERCGWWVDNEEKTLCDTLLEAMALSSDELCNMGEKGRQWMTRDFSWDSLGMQMSRAYEWLLYGGTKPDCVFVD